MEKVVIIGAGPAGLTAGYELLEKSTEYEVIILEESEQIGGISRTVNYKGNRMEVFFKIRCGKRMVAENDADTGRYAL